MNICNECGADKEVWREMLHEEHHCEQRMYEIKCPHCKNGLVNQFFMCRHCMGTGKITKGG